MLSFFFPSYRPVIDTHVTLGLDEGAAGSSADVTLCPTCGMSFDEMEHLTVYLEYGVLTSIWHDSVFHEYRGVSLPPSSAQKVPDESGNVDTSEVSVGSDFLLAKSGRAVNRPVSE